MLLVTRACHKGIRAAKRAEVPHDAVLPHEGMRGRRKWTKTTKRERVEGSVDGCDSNHLPRVIYVICTALNSRAERSQIEHLGIAIPEHSIDDRTAVYGISLSSEREACSPSARVDGIGAAGIEGCAAPARQRAEV